MKHPADLAPPERPEGTRLRNDRLGIDAERLAEALPVGIVVRHNGGRLVFLNRAAKGALRVGDVDPIEMSLTIIRRGVGDAPEKNVYLLSASHEALVRLVASPLPFGLGEIGPLEVLVIDELESGRSPAESTEHTTATTPRRSAASPRRRPSTAPGQVFAPRDLLACAARRLRRHFRNQLRLDVSAAPTKRCDRRSRLDEIAFAEVLLSAAEWLLPRCAAERLEISATISGHRLRIVLDGQPAEASDPSQSGAADVDRDWLRTVRPFLDQHRATFEIHDDADRIGIVIAMPLLR